MIAETYNNLIFERHLPALLLSRLSHAFQYAMSAETVVSHALFEHDGELNVEDALNDLLRGSEPVKASSEDPSDENEGRLSWTDAKPWLR